MNELIKYGLLRTAAEYFQTARTHIYAGAKLLYEIDQTNAWEGKYSSFSEYVEQECQLSRGFASKLLQAWKYYVIDGGVSHDKLVGIDAEKLYLALRLPSGSPEDKLLKAREWNRDDLRAELSTTDGMECQHPEEKHVILCGKCSRRIG